jgi:riboflavin kinase / FMN adenylyltransferase
VTVIDWDSLRKGHGAEIIEGLLAGKNGASLTIGGFDGPHLGHESLFRAVLAQAKNENLLSGIVTFNRSPRREKKPESFPGEVSTLGLRLDFFERRGFDFVALIDFSGDFGKMKGSVFFDILVKTVHLRYVAVGPDFRCGHRLDTGVSEITDISRKDGFRLDSIQQVDLDGNRISSSLIREAIRSADFTLAERLLGHPFLLDFKALSWTKGERSLIARTDECAQILPRWGEYRVVLETDSGLSEEGNLSISAESLLVTPSPEKSFSDLFGIRTIRFRLS